MGGGRKFSFIKFTKAVKVFTLTMSLDDGENRNSKFFGKRFNLLLKVGIMILIYYQLYAGSMVELLGSSAKFFSMREAWKKGSVFFMSIQLVIVCLYIAMLFGISFWVKRRADKGATEYLFAGRKLSSTLIAVNITGLAVGAASTVGVAERAFSIGMAAGWYNAAWAAGSVVMGLAAAGKLRAMKVSTIPEFFEKYYDIKGRVISAIGLVIIMCVITALQYLAGGAILSSLLPDIFSFQGGMLMSAVVFIGITLIGGLWSSGLANIVSVTLIYLGILYSCVSSVSKVGGWDALVAKLPDAATMVDPLAGIPLVVIISWFVVMITQAITAQGPVQIACGAKDAKTARNGFLLGGLLILPVGFVRSSWLGC